MEEKTRRSSSIDFQQTSAIPSGSYNYEQIKQSIENNFPSGQRKDFREHVKNIVQEKYTESLSAAPVREEGKRRSSISKVMPRKMSIGGKKDLWREKRFSQKEVEDLLMEAWRRHNTAPASTKKKDKQVELERKIATYQTAVNQRQDTLINSTLAEIKSMIEQGVPLPASYNYEEFSNFILHTATYTEEDKSALGVKALERLPLLLKNFESDVWQSIYLHQTGPMQFDNKAMIALKMLVNLERNRTTYQDNLTRDAGRAFSSVYEIVTGKSDQNIQQQTVELIKPLLSEIDCVGALNKKAPLTNDTEKSIYLAAYLALQYPLCLHMITSSIENGFIIPDAKVMVQGGTFFARNNFLPQWKKEIGNILSFNEQLQKLIQEKGITVPLDSSILLFLAHAEKSFLQSYKEDRFILGDALITPIKIATDDLDWVIKTHDISLAARIRLLDDQIRPSLEKVSIPQMDSNWEPSLPLAVVNTVQGLESKHKKELRDLGPLLNIITEGKENLVERFSEELTSFKAKAKDHSLSAMEWGLLFKHALEQNRDAIFPVLWDASANRREDLKKVIFENGDTLLHVAVLYSFSSIVDFLHNCPDMVNTKNKEGYTPAHLAVQNGKVLSIHTLHKLLPTQEERQSFWESKDPQGVRLIDAVRGMKTKEGAHQVQLLLEAAKSCGVSPETDFSMKFSVTEEQKGYVSQNMDKDKSDKSNILQNVAKFSLDSKEASVPDHDIAELMPDPEERKVMQTRLDAIPEHNEQYMEVEKSKTSEDFPVSPMRIFATQDEINSQRDIRQKFALEKEEKGKKFTQEVTLHFKPKDSLLERKSSGSSSVLDTSFLLIGSSFTFKEQGGNSQRYNEAPLPKSEDHQKNYYRFMMQQKAGVMVSLTSKPKAENFLLEKGQEILLSNKEKVSCTNKQNYGECITIRTLECTKGNKRYTAYHVDFQGWPDGGVPDKEAFRALIKMVRKCQKDVAKEQRLSEKHIPLLIGDDTARNNTALFIGAHQQKQLLTDAKLKNRSIAQEVDIESIQTALRYNLGASSSVLDKDQAKYLELFLKSELARSKGGPVRE